MSSVHSKKRYSDSILISHGGWARTTDELSGITDFVMLMVRT
jgi:hypothetical protein